MGKRMSCKTKDFVKYTCNLCKWECIDDQSIPIKYRLKRHEEWHNPKLPYVTKNKIFGKVEWEIEIHGLADHEDWDE
tara:strand:- start:3278 stop:3508 length:231 start_codon:yes stop_codon:yes gene_type:complete